MALRHHIFDALTNVFKRHGAITIDTPTFELTSILTNKYGQESKLIYNLQESHERLSLRYDLTVPFARYLAMNGIRKMKRYAFGKVFRKDRPVLNKGRFREFYQCDFDIAGEYNSMISDAQVLRVMQECLDAVGISPYAIKVNHRKLLEGIFQVCGISKEHFISVCSSIDKLDKVSWEVVREELVYVKLLPGDAADRIYEFVQMNGNESLLSELKKNAQLQSNESAATAIKELQLLSKYLNALGVENIIYDLSLARGLDYYTGVIYEAVVVNDQQSGIPSVGSVASGGRYDDLVGSYLNAAKGISDCIPCVGMSVGIERIHALLKAKHTYQPTRANSVQFYVICVGGGLIEERMAIAKELWDAGFSAEFELKENPRLQTQLSKCDRDGIPYAIIIGPQELGKGVVRLKNMQSKEAAMREGDKAGIEIERKELVAHLTRMLNKQ